MNAIRPISHLVTIPSAIAIFVAISLSCLPGRAATRFWTGASASSGNWTTPANWQGNIPPVAGDVLQFVDTRARKTSNTNNSPAGTRFSVINCFGVGSYRLRGNPVTITNSLNVGNPAGSHTVDFDITFAPLEGSPSIDVFAGTSSLTINGDVNLGSHTLQIDGSGDVTICRHHQWDVRGLRVCRCAGRIRQSAVPCAFLSRPDALMAVIIGW